MRHKHADLIIEWANGAKVQVKFGDDQWLDTCEPMWLESAKAKYRIKPEPKPDVVVRYGAIASENGLFEGWKNPNLKLTFDGETGELKAAEVLK